MSLLWFGIASIVLGILAVPSLLLSKKPNAKELLEKIAPYQGWIGVICCLYGLWGVIDAIRTIDWIGMHIVFTIAWIVWLAVSVSLVVLGFMLGYNLVVEYVLSKNEKTAEKGEQVRAKLAPMQGKLGIFGVIAGLAAVAFWIYIRFFLM